MLIAKRPQLNRCTGPNLERLPAERLPAGYDQVDVAVLRWIAAQRREAGTDAVIASLHASAIKQAAE